MEQNSSSNVLMWVIALIILIVVGIVAWSYWGGDDMSTVNVTTPVATSTNTTSPTATPATSTATTSANVGVGASGEISVGTPRIVNVTYNGTSFSPASVTLNKGDQVRFTNSSSGQMWVASASHPTHTDYPAFDQKKNVGNGGTYMFTFDKAGTWKYHNHSNATAFGTVIVK